MATASGIGAFRRAAPGSAGIYRNWAVHGELVRAAFDVKLGQLSQAEWDLVPFNYDGPKPDPGKIARMREILNSPNPAESSLGSFLTALGEDVLTLDAGAYEKERTYRGEIFALWPSDGALIQLDKFWNGDPRSPRFYYVPKPDTVVPLLNIELGYIKVHNRSYSPLGIPPLETLKATIDAELSGSFYNARQVSQAAPDGIMDLGENARPDQVEGFKSLWDSLIAGKSMMAFWGGTKSAKFIPFKTSNKDMQFLEWQMYLVRKLCAVLQISPQDLGFTFDINKSTGEVQQEQTDERGTFPFLGTIQDVVTNSFCWDPSFGGPRNNIAFRFLDVTDRQSLAQAEIQKLTVAGMPTETINEARRKSGKAPIGDPTDETNQFNQLMANTPLGLVRIDDLPSAREVAIKPVPETPKALPEPKRATIDDLQLQKLMLEEIVQRHQVPLLSDGAIQVNVTPELKIASAALDIAPPIINVAPPEVRVEAPIVNVAPPEVTVDVDTAPFMAAVGALRDEMTKKSARPDAIIRREVIRDRDGRIAEIIDHRED